ncbi:aminotransferase class I/II-fold pyridoxal phosphate-dependent enzyme [Candidatus Paracaedibacter symbiosus]|uniref:aminotransferase class I/II-fold pyridoxal phosphate-dependent enzyme n=1 Tax=Candidatus Paracaedibacter symbiosus TaxID=244582 RepID=UPI000509C406|nr:8-amino-7-oxononanoate synthase [Candidatus Paracaedibacter symbiosus]
MPHNLYKKALLEKKTSATYRTLGVRPPSRLCFASNDYLGLSNHPAIKQELLNALELDRVGATGSRLLSGNAAFINAFENQIALDKNQEAALIFNSGFQANLTILATLLNKQILGQEPLVFADRLNHASMHAGCQLAGIRQQRYQHLDLNHLETLLKKHQHLPRPKFILTESIFGMDGDQIDLESLSQLADKHGAFLYVDEAHATGVAGNHGYGLTSSCKGRVHGAMGTFSKALGLAGAYFAGDTLIKDYLVNFAPGFIYSTAQPFPILYAANKAWNMVRDMEAERSHLQLLRSILQQELDQLGLATTPSTSHIFAIVFRCADRTLAVAEKLKNQGIAVSVIRPPTVPMGSSRLRIALKATHRIEDIQQLVEALKNNT